MGVDVAAVATTANRQRILPVRVQVAGFLLAGLARRGLYHEDAVTRVAGLPRGVHERGHVAQQEAAGAELHDTGLGERWRCHRETPRFQGMKSSCERRMALVR